MSIDNFEHALQDTVNNQVAVTENGAVGFKTSSSKLLDMNFMVSSFRDKTDADIEKAFADAFYENPIYAVKWLFFARDVRGGMGERRLFRVCLKWLSVVRPELVKNLVSVVAEYGRFDDLLCLLGTSTEDAVVDYIDRQWVADCEGMAANKPISLLAKWLPSVTTSSPKTVASARLLCRRLNLGEKQYRKTLSAMRRYLSVIEQKMSAKEWRLIEYSAVPSRANIKYKDAFMRNDAERRSEYLKKLEKGEEKINSATNFPSDIVHSYKTCCDYDYYTNSAKYKEDSALEAMWKSLPDYVAGSDSAATICVCDSSGSMETRVGKTDMTAMDVAYSIGIYFSERLAGPFKNKVVTFSESPEYIDMTNAKTLADKLGVMRSHSEVADTNIEAVFDLLLETAVRNRLPQSDIPANVMIISDMEFNMAQGSCCVDSAWSAKQASLFAHIGRKWADAGYRLPRLVFWNVNSRTGTVPMQTNENGVTLVSGYSPAVAKMVFSAKLDPYAALVETLDSKRYEAIGAAIGADA